MGLTGQDKEDLFAQYTREIVSGQDADRQAQKKALEAERREKNRQFTDKNGELEVVGHKRTGMQQPSSSTGFARGPVASGQFPRVPR